MGVAAPGGILGVDGVADMPLFLLPESLRSRLGEEAARDLVELVNAAGRAQREDTVMLVGERFERRVVEVQSGLEQRITQVKSDLEQRIAEVKSELEQRIVEVKSELEQRINAVKSELEQRIAHLRADLIKWMFVFWMGQVAVMAGLVGLLYNLLR